MSDCNCNGNWTATSTADFTIQQGDTFPIYFTYSDGETTSFPSDVTVGLYGYSGECLVEASTEDGTLVAEGQTLVLNLSHEQSVAMSGVVEMEITLHDGITSVDHADKVIRISFEPRKNNDLL